MGRSSDPSTQKAVADRTKHRVPLQDTKRTTIIPTIIATDAELELGATTAAPEAVPVPVAVSVAESAAEKNAAGVNRRR